MTKITVDKALIEQAIEAAFSPYCAQALGILVPALRAALAKPTVAPCSELVEYILQDDIRNRLTLRVVDIAFSAFVLGRSGTNSDDGGPCDWFNDTKPMVMEQLAKVKKDLAEEAAPLPEPSPPPPAEVPLMTDSEIGALVRVASKGGTLNRDGSTSQRIARAIEQAVRRNAGLK